MSNKIFDNDLVAKRKNKVTLTLNKPAYIGMCILELSKVLMHEFHYDCIKNMWLQLKTIIRRHWFNGVKTCFDLLEIKYW